jgi:chorismate synthase
MDQERMRLDLKTAGDSHGPGLSMILIGIPAGLELDELFIQMELARRRSGPGRSGRQDREKDEFEILGGVHEGFTTGAPISAIIHNKVRDNGSNSLKKMRIPRPGHADLAGAMKYGFNDVRPIAERASARETAARVVGGAICKLLLKHIDVSFCSRILTIGENNFLWDYEYPTSDEIADNPEMFAPDKTHISWGGQETIDLLITNAEQHGYNLGATLQIIAMGLPPGLGSHIDWRERLDGRIAQLFLSVPAVKGIDIGDPEVSRLKSTDAQDAILPDPAYPWIFKRRTNHAGGLEGGCTNGEPLLVNARFKPIPTSDAPMESVELTTLRSTTTSSYRHDTCPVSAATVILENMLALALADAALEKFGGDTLNDFLAAREHYLDRLKSVEAEKNEEED